MIGKIGVHTQATALPSLQRLDLGPGSPGLPWNLSGCTWELSPAVNSQPRRPLAGVSCPPAPECRRLSVSGVPGSPMQMPLSLGCPRLPYADTSQSQRSLAPLCRCLSASWDPSRCEPPPSSLCRRLSVLGDPGGYEPPPGSLCSCLSASGAPERCLPPPGPHCATSWGWGPGRRVVVTQRVCCLNT